MRLLPLPVILAALVLASCGCGSGTTTQADRATSTDEQGGAAKHKAKAPGDARGARGDAGKARADGTEVVAADSQYGSILFDSKEQAIYLFDKEGSAKSECYGACAEAWPPVLTDGGPQAGKGVDAKLLGTTKRDDGSTQVTYAGHPLYYYVEDPPGQVLCQNVSEFGGLWLVVQPSGEPVRS